MKYWYNPIPCFGKPISQSHSLSHPHRQPNPLPSLLWRAPGWRLAGLRPNITTRPLCSPSMQQNRNSRPCFSVIGPWFVRLLTMAADWVTCYVGNIWARFLAPLADGSRGSLHNTEQHFRNIRNDPMLWWGKQQKVCTGKVLTKWSCDPWDTVGNKRINDTGSLHGNTGWSLMILGHSRAVLVNSWWSPQLPLIDLSPFPGLLTHLGASKGLRGQKFRIGFISKAHSGPYFDLPPANLAKLFWAEMACTGVKHIVLHVLCLTRTSGGYFRPSDLFRQKHTFCKKGPFPQQIWLKLVRWLLNTSRI